MKYWYDTEFIEDGKTIDLISIGIIAEDDREFYAESIEADLFRANDWVRDNVISQLWSQQADKREGNQWLREGGCGGFWHRQEIANGILSFVGHDKPEFWAYYADYDWVALCQLYGRMIDLPKGWPMYCRDLKQWCDSIGNPRLPKQDKEHHALADARWTRDAWLFLQAKEKLGEHEGV